MDASLGRVFGRINTNSFEFKAKTEIKKLQYIKVMHKEEGPILCIINDVANINGEIIAKCQVVGYRDIKGVLKIPKTPLEQETFVFHADEIFIQDILRLEERENTAYIGLLENYSRIKVNLDIQRMITRHVAVLAKTGSGKSYLSGVLIEELMDRGVPLVIIDPHGEYGSMRTPNKSLTDGIKYEIKPRGYADIIKEYSPSPELNPGTEYLGVSISEISAHQLSKLTPIKLSGSQIGMLYNVIQDLKEKNEHYELEDIRRLVDMETNNAKWNILASINYLDNLGVFSKKPTKEAELVKPGKASIINLKGISPEIQEVIVARLCAKLFELRKLQKVPPFLLLIEESHNFCPERSFGEATSSYIIRSIASEGRKFGIGLCVVTQRPARIDKNVLSQCGTQMILKVTNPNDVKAVINSSEGITSEASEEIKNLPIGTGLIIGASDIPLFVDVRQRKSQHGGETTSIVSSGNKKETGVNFIELGSSINYEPAYYCTCTIKDKKLNLLVNSNTTELISTKDGRILKLKPSLIKNLSTEEKIIISKVLKGINKGFDNTMIQEMKKKGLVKELNNEVILNEDFKHMINITNMKIAYKPEYKMVKQELIEKGTLTQEKIKESLKSIGFTVNDMKECYYNS